MNSFNIEESKNIFPNKGFLFFSKKVHPINHFTPTQNLSRDSLGEGRHTGEKAILKPCHLFTVAAETAVQC